MGLIKKLKDVNADYIYMKLETCKRQISVDVKYLLNIDSFKAGLDLYFNPFRILREFKLILFKGVETDLRPLTLSTAEAGRFSLLVVFTAQRLIGGCLILHHSTFEARGVPSPRYPLSLHVGLGIIGTLNGRESCLRP